MKTNKKARLLQVILFIFFTTILFKTETTFATTITTVEVKEKAGVTTSNYPLTFGHVFKKGDVPNSVKVTINGQDIPTQFDIKRHWDDNSVKHGVISVIIPQIQANSTVTLTIETNDDPNNSGAMTKSDIQAKNIESRIDLTNLSGSGYSGNLTASLRDSINNESNLNYWLQGPVVTEILVNQQLNNSLNATWEARYYPETNFGVRVSNGMENVNLSYRGNISYDVSILTGTDNLSTQYTKQGYLHTHNSRWRKVFWIGQEPPETEIHYNINYLINTGMVMNYDTQLTIAESEMEEEYNNWQNADTDIDGNGFITKYFPMTGGRREIGIQPKWTAMYLLSMDNRMREIMLGNAEMAGHCPIHYREDDSNMTFYNHGVSINDRPDIDLMAGTGIPAAIGDVDNNGWRVDRSHQGSFAYIPYLITGDYWYLQEMYYWASFNLAYDNYGRDGHGNPQDFSAGHDGSYGALYDQTRGFAWSLRNISDAAVLATDTGLEKDYFANKVGNNIEWHLLGNTETSHGLHMFRNMREHADDLNPWKTREAPWQHDFIVLVFSDMLRKQVYDTDKIKELRDRWGSFTVGRFTQTDFNKWDGAGYWWPLRRRSEDNTGDYYSNGSWSDYWNDLVLMDQEVPMNQGLPHSDFSRYDYPDSYAFIARATLANLTNLPEGNEAYSFLDNNLTTSLLSTNPTWAIVPTQDSPASNQYRADVDNNSQINTTDAMLTLRNSLGLDMSGTNWQSSSTTGDVNCDGNSNSTDAMLILRYSLGLDMSGTGWCI